MKMNHWMNARATTAIRVTAIVLFLFACWSLSAAELLRGPYLSNPKMDGMTVSWVTDVPNAGQVEYGETDNYGSVAPIWECKPIRRKDKNNVLIVEQVCRVRLRNLVPGTTYHYKVSGAGLTKSVASSFRIPKIDSPLTVVFLGDEYSCGEGNILFDQDVVFIDKYVKTGTAIGKDEDGVDLIVDVGDTMQHAQILFSPYECLRRIPIIIAAGNHCNETNDDKGGILDKDTLQRYFDYEHNKLCHVADYGPTRWVVKAWEGRDQNCDQGHMHNYGGDWNDVFTAEGVKWLEDSLSGTTRSWKFFVGHNPSFTDSSRSDPKHGDCTARRQQLWPILMKHNVRLAFNGHDHIYQRTHQIDGAGKETANGVYGLTVSGGNYARYQESPWMAKIFNQPDGCAPLKQAGKWPGWHGPTYVMVNGTDGICEAFNKMQQYRKDDSFRFSVPAKK
ncbi:MAG: metallophosphoesterase family protein [Planctomycetota bacterium]